MRQLIIRFSPREGLVDGDSYAFSWVYQANLLRSKYPHLTDLYEDQFRGVMLQQAHILNDPLYKHINGIEL